MPGEAGVLGVSGRVSVWVTAPFEWADCLNQIALPLRWALCNPWKAFLESKGGGRENLMNLSNRLSWGSGLLLALNLDLHPPLLGLRPWDPDENSAPCVLQGQVAEPETPPPP